MRALNTARRPIMVGGDTINSGFATPRIDLEQVSARQLADPAPSVGGAAEVVTVKTTFSETVRLPDGTQISFGTLGSPFNLETV